MTHFVQDTLRQPSELQRVFEHLRGDDRPALDAAAAAARSARHVHLTGIGISCHAAQYAGALFRRRRFL